MSIYRFSEESPVASVAFHYANGAPTSALIETSKAATDEHIAEAVKALKEKGMFLVPVTVGDKDMLQVSNFVSEKSVLNTLANVTKGEPAITKEKSDLPPPPKSTFKTFLENYSFRLAGGLNLIGDVSMHLDGYSKITAKFDKKTGQPLTPEQRKASVTAGAYDLVGGGLYTVGGLNAAAFGNSKSKASPLTTRTADFIAYTADPKSSTTNPTKESGNFFQRHAADVTLGAYTAGAGAFLIKGASGYYELGQKLLAEKDPLKAEGLKLNKKESASLMAYGAWSLVCKLLSLFIKEKPKSEQDKPKSHNPIMRGIDWFREKPLRIFGLGSLISETLYARYAYRTYQRVKGTDAAASKSEYIFKIITTLSYYASDFLSAISSKNPLVKPLDADGQREVIARAAQKIVEKPAEKRDELVSQTIKFLTDQPEMQKSDKKSIAASLKSQLDHLGSNPWSKWVEATATTEQKQR